MKKAFHNKCHEQTKQANIETCVNLMGIVQLKLQQAFPQMLKKKGGKKSKKEKMERVRK